MAKQVDCKYCRGRGMTTWGDKCSGCNATGKVMVDEPEVPCPKCKGTGMNPGLGPCKECKGAGYTNVVRG